MAKCGKCKAEGVTVDHVKACYQVAQTVTATFVVKPPAPVVIGTPLGEIPEARYAVDLPGKGIVFAQIERPAKGKWAGHTFVKHLIGHPGDWMKVRFDKDTNAQVVAAIGVDPMAAVQAYATEFVRCGCCDSPLSDPESLARGLGPVCAGRF